MKQALDKIEENSKFIEDHRKNVVFKFSDTQAVVSSFPYSQMFDQVLTIPSYRTTGRGSVKQRGHHWQPFTKNGKYFAENTMSVN